jgi:hypothetical protein
MSNGRGKDAVAGFDIDHGIITLCPEPQPNQNFGSKAQLMGAPSISSLEL